MAFDSLTAPMGGADHREIGGVQLDVARAGDCRVKRVIYPPGFRWARDMKATVGTDLCQHAHVAFLAQGRIHIQYADGCTVEFAAPQRLRLKLDTTAGWAATNRP